MKLLSVIAVFSLLLIITSCNRILDPICGSTSITETEAKETAKTRLIKFSEREGIDPATFSEPKTYKQDDRLWIVDYTNSKDNSESSYFFRVIIDSCGRIETNFQHLGQ